MRPLLFAGTVTLTIYSTARWEAVFYIVLFLFLFGITFVLFYSLYRLLVAHHPH